MNKNEIITTKDYGEFIETKNTIEICNEDDFNMFVIALKRFSIINEVLKCPEQMEYNYWLNLVKINSKGKLDLLFEFDFFKGVTFYTDRQKSIDWYNKEPIRLNKINTEYVCKFCGQEHKDFLLAKFETENETFKSCANCTISELDKIIKSTPKKQKCDCCNSNDSFTITTDFATYHLCKKHTIDFFCLNLSKKSFSKLYKEDEDGRCDFELHDDFYLEDGTASQPNREWAKDLKEMIKGDTIC